MHSTHVETIQNEALLAPTMDHPSHPPSTPEDPTEEWPPHPLLHCETPRYRPDGSVSHSYRSMEHVLQSTTGRTNRYLRRLVHGTEPWAMTFTKLVVCDARMANVACLKSRALKKELVEGVSMLERVETLVAHPSRSSQGDPTEDPTNQGEGYFFLDLCCGKGIASMMLALRFPAATVLGIDLRPPNPTERHLRQDDDDDSPLVTNFVHATANLYDQNHLQELLQQYAPSGSDKEDIRLVVVGTHLCGDLARVALDWIRPGHPPELPWPVTAAASVPCCLPRQKAPAGQIKFRPNNSTSGGNGIYDTTLVARRRGMDPFTLWVDRLAARTAPWPVQVWRDDDMLSAGANVYLILHPDAGHESDSSSLNKTKKDEPQYTESSGRITPPDEWLCRPVTETQA